jgi:hypothetical protein
LQYLQLVSLKCQEHRKVWEPRRAMQAEMTVEAIRQQELENLPLMIKRSKKKRKTSSYHTKDLLSSSVFIIL